jgi:predicted aspartyl protease
VQYSRSVTFAAMLLGAWSGFTPANESLLSPTSAEPPTSGEVVVEAPEPRYVAPTLRDRIGRIWAPVFINGQGPFRLVLDTGSNHSVVNHSVASALGLIPTESRVLMQGVTGSATVPIVNVDSVIVGDLELRAQRLPIVMDALGGAEGVLGGKGLHDKRIFIDFGRDQITILRSRMERAPRGFRTIPVKMQNGLLIADVRVGAMRVSAIIDTGAQITIANLAFREALARRLRSGGELTTTDIIGTTLDVQRGDLVSSPTISFGPMEIRRARIITGDVHIFQHWKMTERPVLLIGMDVLGQFDILIIDYRRKELHVRMRGML